MATRYSPDRLRTNLDALAAAEGNLNDFQRNILLNDLLGGLAGAVPEDVWADNLAAALAHAKERRSEL